MWGNWGTEDSGIICWSHSACFLCIQPIAFKLIFTWLAWIIHKLRNKYGFVPLPLPSPHLEEIAWVIQIICLLYLLVALYLCLWGWDHGRISWGKLGLDNWGNKQVYDITGRMSSQPSCCYHEVQVLACCCGGSPGGEVVLPPGQAGSLDCKLQTRMGLRKRSEPSNWA